MKGMTFDTLEYPLKIDNYKKIWIEIFFISICHQTNWDKLHRYIIKLYEEHPTFFDPATLSILTLEQFTYYLKNGLDSERSRIEERYNFIKIIAAFFNEHT